MAKSSSKTKPQSEQQSGEPNKLSLPQIPNALTPDQVAKITKQVENLQTYYVNHVRISAGYMDVRLFFGEQSITPTGEPVFMEKMCLAMAPEFAQLFLALLATQMMTFEKAFGTVRKPPTQNALQEALVKMRQEVAQ